MNEFSSVDAVEAYKEKLRSLRFGRVPGGNSTEKGIRGKPNPAWERGIKGEHRQDGSFMPYLNGNMDPIRMKDWGENRRTYEAELAKLHTPNPSSQE